MGQGGASSLRYAKGAQGTGINIYMTLRQSAGKQQGELRVGGGNNNFAGTTLAHTLAHMWPEKLGRFFCDWCPGGGPGVRPGMLERFATPQGKRKLCN